MVLKVLSCAVDVVELVFAEAVQLVLVEVATHRLRGKLQIEFSLVQIKRNTFPRCPKLVNVLTLVKNLICRVSLLRMGGSLSRWWTSYGKPLNLLF
jgi:hypothetical protein